MEENNRLIAEFMKVFPREGEKRTHMKEWYSPIDLDFVGLPDELTLAEDLDFNQWHWLMPVVEKIEGVVTDKYYKIQVNINEEECTIYGLYDSSGREIIIDGIGNGYSTKKEATYKAVIEFINEQNK